MEVGTLVEHTVRARRVVAVLSAILFFYGFLLGGLQLVIADAAAEFGAGATGMGALVSAQHLSAMAMPVLMGALSDRIGKKKVLCAFCAIFGLGCLLSGVARSAAVYVLGTLFFGAGYSVCESQCCAVLSDLDREKSARYINLTQGLLCVGAILGPICVQACRSGFGADWRIAFYICAAAFFLLTVPLCMLRFPAAAPGTGKQKTHVGRFFACGVFVALFVAMMFYVGLENGFGYFADSLLTERVQKSGAGAISLYWAGMAVSRLIFSARPYKMRPVLVACFGAAAALFVALAFSGTEWILLAISALIGAAYGPVWSTLVAAAAAQFPESTASATGLMSTACGLGGILYPLLMGATIERASLTAAMLVLAATAAAGGAFCLRLKRDA